MGESKRFHEEKENVSEEIFYHEVLLKWEEIFMDILEMIKYAEDIPEFYYDLCWLFVEFQEKNPVCFSSVLTILLAEEETRKKQPLLEEIYQVGERINELIVIYLTRGVAEGVFRIGINTTETVLFLWASITGILKFVENKEENLVARVGMERKEFLDYSFGLLFQSIRVA
ncbi:MAG: hypothetical protein LBM95_04320 [Lactobacillales bacterium]|nr:hypothetical protein [Lactobacillales bacterium]